MDATTINRFVRALGSTYGELLADGLAQGKMPAPLFNEGENEDLVQQLVPGIELWFWADTSRLERISVTLQQLVDRDTTYTGELPTPFTHNMDQASVRARLGEPYRSKGPAKLPPPIGTTGGWDAYRLGNTVHPNAEVAIQYLGDKSVSGLSFRLIDKGHD